MNLNYDKFWGKQNYIQMTDEEIVSFHKDYSGRIVKIKNGRIMEMRFPDPDTFEWVFIGKVTDSIYQKAK